MTPSRYGAQIPLYGPEAPMKMRRNTMTHRGSEAAKWRWAKTVCDGPCKVKGKHLRGHKDCDKNPDPGMFAFESRAGR
jgi:hypothetical protein